MATREEIREGIGAIVVHNASDVSDSLVDKVVWYLHSQGVAIKVKCPDCEWSQFKDETAGMTPCCSCNSTGYTVEPLIEEE